MDALAVAVRLHKACRNDNLTIAIVIVISTLHTVEQTTLVKGLAGNITGSLNLAILGIHCYILSCHSYILYVRVAEFCRGGLHIIEKS